MSFNDGIAEMEIMEIHFTEENAEVVGSIKKLLVNNDYVLTNGDNAEVKVIFTKALRISEGDMLMVRAKRKE